LLKQIKVDYTFCFCEYTYKEALLIHIITVF
jgi:hypothetical protein